MARRCSDCAMWVKSTRHGRGTRTGYCTHPRIGRITRGDDACPFYVRAYGTGFDENVALDAFTRLKDTPKGPNPEPAYRKRPLPEPVDVAALRARSKREKG